MLKRVKIYKGVIPVTYMKKEGGFVGLYLQSLNLSSHLFNNFISKECSNSLVTKEYKNGN